LTVEPVLAGLGVGEPTFTVGGEMDPGESLQAEIAWISQPDQLWEAVVNALVSQ